MSENPKLDKKYFETLLKAAEAGYVDVMRELGNLYLEGDGVERNVKEGVKWLQRALDSGDLDAAVDFYDYRHDRAIEYLTKAAEHNHIKAIKSLVEIYENSGEYDKVFALAQKGAALGSSELMRRQAECYLKGQGVDKDELKALELYIKLVERHGNNCDDSDDLRLVVKIYNKHYKFTDKKIFKYYRTTEKLGKFNAMFGIAAELYKTDKFRALKWYKLAADAGDYDAVMAMVYILQHDVDFWVKDVKYHEAVRWYEASAEFGDLNAMKNLVMMYRDGYRSYGGGWLKDKKKSMAWLNRLMEMEGGKEDV